MRMWNVDVTKMCRQHLLGEHLEMHMFVGCVKKKRNIEGYIKGGLVEVHNIKKRHDMIAEEMRIRGYNHKSLMKFDHAKKSGFVDVKRNIEELKSRCERCKL